MSDNTPTRGILTVRDHTQPCEHGERLIRAANGNEGRNIGHFVETEGGGFGDGVWCPGGREIVLKAIEGFTFPPHDKTVTIELIDPNPKVWVEVSE